MKKVIIIGAGPGGLTAAAEILEQPEDFSVTVLEASDAIGGISQTVRHNGNRMDIGGHRFFSKDDRIIDVYKRQSERLLGSCISVKFLCHKSGCQSPADKQMPVDYALLFP